MSSRLSDAARFFFFTLLRVSHTLFYVDYLSLNGQLIGHTFTGVTDDTNEDFVPFWSNRVRVLLLCMFLYRCVKLSVQMEPNGPLQVRLVPFVPSQSYGGS